MGLFLYFTIATMYKRQVIKKRAHCPGQVTSIFKWQDRNDIAGIWILKLTIKLIFLIATEESGQSNLLVTFEESTEKKSLHLLFWLWTSLLLKPFHLAYGIINTYQTFQISSIFCIYLTGGPCSGVCSLNSNMPRSFTIKQIFPKMLQSKRMSSYTCIEVFTFDLPLKVWSQL